MKKHQRFLSLVRFKLSCNTGSDFLFLLCEYVYVNLNLCLFIIKKHWTGRTELFSMHLF